MDRTAEIARETAETQIQLRLNLDGTGTSTISTGVGFLDHMLELFAKHGFFDLEIEAKGDLHVDAHHTTEDVGICLGQAVQKAVLDKAGMRRFGSFAVPMYESLAKVDLDVCGRPYLHYETPLRDAKVGDFDVELAEEFFHGFANHSGTTLHINVPYGTNQHHIIEAIFKAVAKALHIATRLDASITGVLSTKGSL
ncbi:imidazoleglycerol-phosphate dehydratase HisB [Candidatus Poribacteria bacterium]|nr:imidazoleglycerol-phosphate dehydratase HisB [Candidatus Poribacteria bacterium]MXY29460.1 imidazoleglycerol-phosphate dehydratase HisB [Candidatus Poribacteria bacterium]MYK16944.1 imidazoleglycerol-phosphate dehydratase HisB [Candidatus Poribacteria bacterium]